MSVAAGRTYLLICSFIFLVSSSWFIFSLLSVNGEFRKLSMISVLSASVGFIAAVGLCTGAALFARFAEVSIELERVVGSEDEPKPKLVVRQVLSANKAVPLKQLERIVLLQNLMLPALHGATGSMRAVIWKSDGGRMAFTPKDGALQGSLERLGISVTTDAEALTPRQAARRYPGSVSLWELCASALPWVAIVGTALSVLWVVYEAM